MEYALWKCEADKEDIIGLYCIIGLYSEKILNVHFAVFFERAALKLQTSFCFCRPSLIFPPQNTNTLH